MQYRTKDGHEVSIDTIHVSKSYAGLYLGPWSPSQVIDRGLEYIKTFWGAGRKIHVIEPEITVIEGRDWGNGERIPEHRLILWLCSDAFDPKKMDGSHIFVLAFMSLEDESRLPITALVSQLEWEKIAVDFEY